MIRVGMIGLGQTGAELARVLLKQTDLEVVAAVTSPGSEKAGKDLGEILGCGTLGIVVEDARHLEQVLLRTFPDVMVDFTNPDASLRNARLCSKWNVSMVIGTNGFSQQAMTKLFAIGSMQKNGIVYAPNNTDLQIVGIGTVRAVRYIVKKKGFYEMSDVLDLPDRPARRLTPDSQTPPPIERKGKEPGVPSPSGNAVWSGRSLTGSTSIR